jgi:hypothetical protein
MPKTLSNNITVASQEKRAQKQAVLNLSNVYQNRTSIKPSVCWNKLSLQNRLTKIQKGFVQQFGF